MSGIFKGFNIQVPVYDAYTPQTLRNVKLRSMNFSDEEKLKASIIDASNGYSIIQLLNEVIYNCIINKEDGVSDTYNNFLKNFTTADRDSLLIGLYHATYGDEQHYSTTCPSCNKSYKFKIKYSDGFTINEADNTLLDKTFEIKLPDTDIIFNLKSPTLQKELEVLQVVGMMKNVSLLTLLTYTDSVKYKPDGSKSYKTINNYTDIEYGIKTLLPKQAKFLLREIEDKISKYNSSLNYKVVCPYCKKEDTFIVNPVDELFRLVYESR